MKKIYKKSLQGKKDLITFVSVILKTIFLP
jgi:hypothetical protein